nr:hypothetical protein [Chloroflexota bacterium]
MSWDTQRPAELGQSLLVSIPSKASGQALPVSSAWRRSLTAVRPQVSHAFGIGLLLCMAGLVWLYLYIPAGFEQPLFWSPRPNHSVEVSALYRTAFGLPAITLSSTGLHWLNVGLLILSCGCYVGALVTAPRDVLT